MKRGRCPLTDLAGHYTRERSDNFDTLTAALVGSAQKAIFGALFAVGELFMIALWWII